MHKNRYLFPYPYSLPLTVCHQPFMAYLYLRAMRGQNRCMQMIKYPLKVDHVYRFEVYLTPEAK